VQVYLSMQTSSTVYSHFQDVRFSGVYHMMARSLPMDRAVALRDAAVLYGARNATHSLSDQLVRIVEQRRRKSQA
jgi:hypothetical protein